MYPLTGSSSSSNSLGGDELWCWLSVFINKVAVFTFTIKRARKQEKTKKKLAWNVVDGNTTDKWSFCSARILSPTRPELVRLCPADGMLHCKWVLHHHRTSWMMSQGRKAINLLLLSFKEVIWMIYAIRFKWSACVRAFVRSFVHSFVQVSDLFPGKFQLIEWCDDRWPVSTLLVSFSTRGLLF